MANKFETKENNLIGLQATWIEKAKELIELKEKARFFKNQVTIVSEDLKILSDFERVYLQGYEFRSYDRPGSIDYGSIPQLQDINLEIYRGEPVQCWKLTYNKEF